MTPRPEHPLQDLARVVADAYEAFSPYKVSGSLDVCRCNTCMDEATEKYLRTTPLRKISVGGLCEFTNSAHGEGRLEEVKYFLPRYFDVMSQGDACSFLEGTYSLDRLRHWDWRIWPENEARVVELFAVTFYWATMIHPDKFFQFPLNDTLILLSRIRVDILPLIKSAVTTGDKRDLVNIYDLWQEVKGDGLYGGSWTDTPEPARAVVHYLSSTEALEAGLNALDQPQFPELNARLSEGLNFFLSTPSKD